MAFGLGVLKLSPTAFWRATPRELSAAAAAMMPSGHVSAPSRSRLSALMQQFPDTPARVKPQNPHDPIT